MSNNLFKNFALKEIERALASLSKTELLESAKDCVVSAEEHLKAARILFSESQFKTSQTASINALEELSKTKAILDLIENKKTAKEVTPFFKKHDIKLQEIYGQEKYSKQRVVLNKQAAFVSFTTLKSRPIIFANEGFENLAKHEIEDAEKGIKEMSGRIELVEKHLSYSP